MLSKSVHPVKVSMFDRNTYLFNCANGTIDFSTLEFRPHDPEDFITKVSPISYDPDAICSRWNRFIDEIMQGKTADSRYLQKAVGYTMTGDTSLSENHKVVLYVPTKMIIILSVCTCLLCVVIHYVERFMKDKE